MSDSVSADIRRATLAGLSGYVIWGLSPLFFQALDFASAVEIILHRIVWAVPFLALVLIAAMVSRYRIRKAG